jgi:hypothetical protein
MNLFKSRILAAWIFALPIAYALVVDTHHRLARLQTDPQFEIAKELRLGKQTSFVHFFLLTFGFLVLLMVVVDALATLIRRLFPERGETPKPVA